MRKGTWRVPPVGLPSTARICPRIWRSYPISGPAISQPSQCVSIATGSGAAGSTGAAARPGRRRIASPQPAAVPQARRRLTHHWSACHQMANRSAHAPSLGQTNDIVPTRRLNPIRRVAHAIMAHLFHARHSSRATTFDAYGQAVLSRRFGTMVLPPRKNEIGK